jgi:heme oxygenase (biliverdin-producing, ferredoxin)
MDDRFSAQLRALTWADHRRAEQMPYLDALVGGRLPLAGYTAMVAQHYPIYEALEKAAANLRSDPVAGPFLHRGLTRLPALASDLRALAGDDWPAVVVPSPATARYVARIEECATWPGGLIAHHYTRYLGDLSGGQYIARAVRRLYGPAGTDFYVFDALGDLAEFRQRYRDQLDATVWPDGERTRVLDEVVLAYQLNIDVLDDLGRALEEAR